MRSSAEVGGTKGSEGADRLGASVALRSVGTDVAGGARVVPGRPDGVVVGVVGGQGAILVAQ
jgi:hypothetical protein